MKDDVTTIDDNDTSGFTGNLMSEMEHNARAISSGTFGNITPLYESENGHSLIVTATRYGKRFVLKGLKPEFRYNPTYRLILQKEFEIGLQLDHPDIVRTIGFEMIDSLGPVIVMEYVDGETLETLIRRGDISPERAASIVRQLSEAIGYMHSKQIIHRDIKPSNIMVTHVGEIVKLIDFSLADSDSYVIIKSQAGTRVYMAPELDNADAVSNVRTDLYSFGIIVRELAEASCNRRLLPIARRCTQRDPRLRAGSVRELHIDDALKGNIADVLSLDSAVLTWILAIIAIILAIVIIAT